jgi:hypothetical protein
MRAVKHFPPHLSLLLSHTHNIPRKPNRLVKQYCFRFVSLRWLVPSTLQDNCQSSLWSFVIFSILPGKLRKGMSTRPRFFLQHTFQFIVHQSSYHPSYYHLCPLTFNSSIRIFLLLMSHSFYTFHYFHLNVNQPDLVQLL